MPLADAQERTECASESTAMFQLRAGHDFSKHETATCVAMKNWITHFTVDVALGTPEQTLSVIADTGSDTLVVWIARAWSSAPAPVTRAATWGTAAPARLRLPETRMASACP